MQNNKVLVITGSYLLSRENNFFTLLKKQLVQLKKSEHAWLELSIKVMVAQILFTNEIWKGFLKVFRKDHSLQAFLGNTDNQTIPSLTEVSLASLLAREGLDFEAIAIDDLIEGNLKAQNALQSCATVFLSTTYLRDLSELDPLIPLIKKFENRLVVGGPLAATIAPTWSGHEAVDILAVGYGEILIPSIATWIHSGYQTLPTPETGREKQSGPTKVLYSGVPTSLSLDSLPTPDWKIAEKYYNQKFSMVYYESVRGCPYRCAFCNYPYLFDDNKFRTRSAQKMADDWEYLVKTLGVQYITCLDSLFTMPKQRMNEFCNELIRRDIKVKWICYARADDLCDAALTELMAKAGVQQVQIGIESGDNQQLLNMNKRTDADINLRAIQNCRRFDIISVVTLIVGFPGETLESLKNTFKFMKEARPDFHFVIPFSTRVENVPILSKESRAKFGLHTMQNQYSVSPYWTHNTMDCKDAVVHAKKLAKDLLLAKTSLDATSFYNHILAYETSMHENLLKFQKRSYLACLPLVFFFDGIFGIFKRALGADLKKWVRYGSS